MLRAENLGYAIDGRALIENLSIAIAPGEVVAVLGPNGAGKSTLLKLLSGELKPSCGNVALNGRPLAQWSAIELARQRAVLPQTESLRFAFDVCEVVALGRFPWGGVITNKDINIVLNAMRAAGIESLAHRRYTKLSVGERARVHLARVLAQVWDASPSATRYLFLDEPTASLDLAHQHETLATLRRFAAEGGGVFMVLHDLNLALQYADRVLLIRNGRLISSGATLEVLTPAAIEAAFDVSVELLQGPAGTQPWIVPRRQSNARPIGSLE